MADPLKRTGHEALNDEMATELKDGDGDRLLEIRRPLDELDAELKDLAGDCIKVVQLLKADSSLLKDRALAVLHLGVSRGCMEIVEQVVKFYKGADSLGDGSERGLKNDEQQKTKATEGESNASSGNEGEDIRCDRSAMDEQGGKTSREEEINASSGDKDARTVALAGLPTQVNSTSKNSDPDPSNLQRDPIRVTAGKLKRRPLLECREYLATFNPSLAPSNSNEINGQPVLDFDKLLRANYLYFGPARELDARGVAAVNGNLDVLALLLSQTPSASRIGPKTRTASLLDFHRDQLSKITERVVKSLEGDSVSLRICQSVFDACREDPEFNFLFWDFELEQERVSEYLFHYLFTRRSRGTLALEVWPILRYLWQEVWEHQGAPGEDPLWQSLLTLHDAQGRTPMHVAVDEDSVWFFRAMLDGQPLEDRVKVVAFALEARDGSGRTPWHHAVQRGNQRDAASDLSDLYKKLADESLRKKVHAPGICDIERNVIEYEKLWQQQPTEDPVIRLRRRGIDVDDLDLDGIRRDNGFEGWRSISDTTPLHRSPLIAFGSETFSPQDTLFLCSVKDIGRYELDALELATLTGNTAAVKVLLKYAAEGPSKIAYTRRQSSKRGSNFKYGWVVGDRTYDPSGFRFILPTVHIAAHSGHYEMLKAFIDSTICDPYIEDDEQHTILHAILDPKKFRIKGDLLDFQNVKHIPPNYEGPPVYEGDIVERQGCINLLLQCGCDIFKVDKDGQAPYPKGSLATNKEFLSWWYDMQLKEFNSNQNAMSFATNAISVMATLVATASYVGPLQPPLGYSSGDGPNQIQAKYIWVRIFIVCDTLSFYLAIAAITFSLIPALPMPQQPMAAELEKTRGMIILAVATLFPSIVCILLAFAAGSIVVISANGVSALGGNLTIITGSIGGVICLIGFLLLLIRLLGIVFPRTHWVRKMYDVTSIFLQGKGLSFLREIFMHRSRKMQESSSEQERTIEEMHEMMYDLMPY